MKTVNLNTQKQVLINTNSRITKLLIQPEKIKKQSPYNDHDDGLVIAH